MKLTKILSGIAAILLVGSALNAATVSYNGTQSVNQGGVYFYLNQFNSGLGTLTAVSLTIYSVQNPGSFTIYDKAVIAETTIVNFADQIQIVANGGGMSTFSGTKTIVSTDPTTSGNGTIVVPGETKLFTLTSTPVLADNHLSPISIASGSWLNYTGNSTVRFTAAASPTADISGGSNDQNYANVTANTTLTITYTYSDGPVPVPEASTVIVQLLIVAGGVWMFVRRRRAAAVRA